MRPRILPYKRASRSARALGRATRIRRLNLVRTRLFNLWGNEVVINWGAGTEQFRNVFGDAEPCWVINKPEAVEIAQHKLRSLEAFKEAGVNCPAFTTDRDEAQAWVDEGRIVVNRRLLRGNSGRGISLTGHEIEDGDHTGIVPWDVPLYTRYVPKFDEYRIHVWMGDILDVQQKRRRVTDNESGYDNRIRNAASGWVFCRGEVAAPDAVLDAAKKAVEACGLDFGAVDVGYTKSNSRACVYEVNTAPGLEGTTLDRYATECRALVR